MKKLFMLVAVLFSLPATAEPVQELYIDNEAGGVIAITLEDCQRSEEHTSELQSH